MLTPRQKEVLAFVGAFTKKNGYSPSLEEIARGLNLEAVSTVHQHIQTLKNKGYLKKQKNQRRSIQASSPEKEMVRIPLMGFIAAGGPITAIKNSEPLDIPRSMLGKTGEHYALRVKGTSMIEEGISDGDIVIIREQPSVENGEKAVAYLPDKDSVTLKKIYREGNRIRLVPANKYMQPFYETNIEIQGKVVGVLRQEH